MQPEGIDIDAGAATPLVSPGPLRMSLWQRRRCRGNSHRAAFAKFVLERHLAYGARDQFAAAHPAPTAASDLNATIADAKLYSLLGGHGDTDDDDGSAGGACPAGETPTT